MISIALAFVFFAPYSALSIPLDILKELNYRHNHKLHDERSSTPSIEESTQITRTNAGAIPNLEERQNNADFGSADVVPVHLEKKQVVKKNRHRSSHSRTHRQARTRVNEGK